MATIVDDFDAQVVGKGIEGQFNFSQAIAGFIDDFTQAALAGKIDVICKDWFARLGEARTPVFRIIKSLLSKRNDRYILQVEMAKEQLVIGRIALAFETVKSKGQPVIVIEDLYDVSTYPNVVAVLTALMEPRRRKHFKSFTKGQQEFIKRNLEYFENLHGYKYELRTSPDEISVKVFQEGRLLFHYRVQ